jgi:hypothetical protein
MRLIKGSLAGVVLTGILALVPAAAFAHGGGGGGGGGHGGRGGGHGFGGGGGGHASIGVGHAFSGFTGRRFSPEFSGMRVFPSGRGDDGRFRDRDFGHHGNFRDNDERHHRHFFNDFDFVAFGFPDWWYPDYGYSDEDAYNDSAPAYGDQYWQDLAMKVQWALSRRGYYHGPIDGVIGPDGMSAIRAFQEAQGLPATGRIDPNVLRALKLPLPQATLRSN